MKECRAVLEQDMHLAASALKQHKDYVNELIDKVRGRLKKSDGMHRALL